MSNAPESVVRAVMEALDCGPFWETHDDPPHVGRFITPKEEP